MKEHDRTSSKPESSFAAELSGNPGDGGNPVEDSAVTFTEKNRANNMPTMANLHAFVTDALIKCLKVLISLDSFNIFRAQPIQSIQNTTAEWKTATTASRSLNTVGEAQQSTYFKHYMHQQTSTNINIHQQNPMYTSTAC